MIVKIIPKIKLPLGANSVFDYEVPDVLNRKIKLGQIVEVEFRNLKIEGMVLEIKKLEIEKLSGRAFTLKPIIRILDEEPVLYEKQIKVLKWISKYYSIPLSLVAKTFIPDVPKLKKLRNKEIKKQGSDLSLAVQRSRLSEIKKAIDEIIRARKNVVFQWSNLREKILVYIKLIEYYVAKDEQVLILLPRITDIEFMLGYLQPKFASKVVVLHGGMGKIDTYAVWNKIRKNQAKIILGTRSSVLASMKNPGLVIVDNEESSDHKQYDMNPRYDARKIAEMLGTRIVFASNAPRVETYYKLRNLVASLPEIKPSTLLGPGKLRDELILVKLVSPRTRVELVDMANELGRGEYSPISLRMEKAMKQSLDTGEKAVLFLNRKGTSTMTICGDCKFVFKCKKCDLPLVYNSDAQELVCHSCGFKQETPLSCPKCKSANIKFVGTGTQRIEHEARKLFPNKKIIRIDKDAQYYKIDIEKYDIIIGTQLLLKDFKVISNIGFLGIVSLDIMLSRPDFRTSEKFYQTIALILGWAGFNRINKVLWQTFSPENELINISARQDYDIFFKREIIQREQFNYPPFTKLVKFIYKDSNQKRALFEALKLANNLRNLNLNEIQVLGPVEPFVKMIRNNYIEFVILKTVDLEVLKKIPTNILKGWLIDVEPEGLS